MQVKVDNPNETSAQIIIVPSAEELDGIKKHVLTHFGHVKVPGFREGKVPSDILEKNVDQNQLQSKFLEQAIEQMYAQAVRKHRLRPVGQPQISVKKFVPFSSLEFEAKVDVVAEIKLPNYKAIKLIPTETKITADDVKNVTESLRNQLSTKKDVDRAARNGDQLWIDFKAVDNKNQPIKGADGKDYPLMLGSNSFIPGFEDNLIGAKPGSQKTFALAFPKDYGVKALAGKKATFTVNVTKVQDVIKPKVDNEFAAKAGPFKTVSDLKADIKKQLSHERRHEAQRQYESQLVQKISDKATVAIPESLINDQIGRLLQDLQQNLTYKGQTMQEYLDQQGMSEEDYKNKILKPQAKARTKASLVLADISEKENLSVTPEELEVRIQMLKGQYKDQKMQEELSKPGVRQEVASRLLTEKTVAKLVGYATNKT